MQCAKGLEETATKAHTHTALVPQLRQGVEETVASQQAGILVNRQHATTHMYAPLLRRQTSHTYAAYQ